MKIMNMWFNWKEIHKETWFLPDGCYVNQIDHVLIEFHENGKKI